VREDWLDARLAAVAALVGQEAGLVADIGADHGRLACALLTARPALRMVVADISADSLAKARRLLEARGLTARVAFRVADGFAALAGERADAVVLAGMGGGTIRKILEDRAWIAGDAALILQPNVDAPALRGWLDGHGFALERETVAMTGGRFYPVMRARRGMPEGLTDKQCALGPRLLEARTEAFALSLRWRRRVLERVLARLRCARRPDAERIAACEREMAWIDEETEAEEPAWK
jgi:tRNA (adenine22-N1)-methyltransferase